LLVLAATFASSHALRADGGVGTGGTLLPLRAEAEFLLVENHGQWQAASHAGGLRAVSTPHAGARLFVFERGLSIVYSGIAGTGMARAGLPSAARSGVAGSLREPRDPSQRSAPVHYRVDLDFPAASPARVLLTDRRAGVQRWYVPGADEAAAAAGMYGGVLFEELYPGIDLACRLEQGGLKYEFRVRPGADPSRIALRYTGAGKPVPRADGGLSFRHAAGTLTDGAPVVWQPAEGSAITPRDTRWVIQDNMLRFYVAGHDATRPLVIDPFLQWSTFLGGSLSDYARDVVTDTQGTIFVSGYSASVDFPVTPGAVQTTPRGSFEAFVAAFSRERRQLWTTYFGGSGSEENPQLAVGTDGAIYLAGSTASLDLPVTPDALQQRNGGRYDVFLVALDAKGRRSWATYFGGSYSDECGDIAVGADGDVYVTGGTYSTNFPVTSDALQTSNNGDHDMFLARFSPKGARKWATYLGGWSMDFAAALALDRRGDVYLAGRTESSNLPGLTLDRQSTYGGGSFDGFVLCVDMRQRAIAWSTYLGGEQEESVERIAIDSEGHVVLAGYTASMQFPLAGNPFQKKHGGLVDVFVARMDANGVLGWSTFLGGVEVDKASGLALDRHDNILLSGFTGSRNFPLAGRAFLDRKGGGYDVFVSQFSPDGAYVWGTFYGGESHDISHGLGMDPQGNAIVVGGTESKGFRTVGNIFQGDLSGLTDAFLLRIVFNEPVAIAGQDTTICRDGSTRLGGEAVGGTPPYQYAWSPATTLSNPSDARPIASPRATTSYVLVVTDAEGAVTADTVTVTVADPPVAEAGADRAVCPGSSAVLQSKVRGGRGPYRFLWAPSAGLNNPEAPNPVAAPERTTRYVLTVTDALGCAARDSLTVIVHPPVEVDAGGAVTACANVPMPLATTVAGGTAPFRYAWTPASGLDNPAAQRPMLTARSDASYIVTVTDANGCADSDTVRVKVFDPPVVDAGDNLALCAGEDGQLRARVSGGKKPYTIEWSPRTGLGSAVALDPTVRPEQTGWYILTVRDGNGCTVRDSVLVTVHPQPSVTLAADVSVCAGVAAGIGAEAVGGTPPYRYRWSPATGLDNATAAMPMAAPSRNTTYTVTVTDANGCTASGTVRVSLQPRPEPRYTDRHQICAGASIELAGSIRGGSPPFTYVWTPPIGLSNPNIANPVVTPSVSATYTLRVTDAAGCGAETRVDVEVIPPPVAQAGEDVTLCDGVPVTLAGRASGGRPPYTILWSPAAGLSSVRDLSPTVRTSASRVYTLTVTDANGCRASDEVAVTVAPGPRANAGDDQRICAGMGASIGASATGGTPPYTYAWSPVNGLDNAAAMAPLARPTQTTEYTLTVTDARGCIATDVTRVFVYPSPDISLPREMTICRDQGRRIELRVTGGSGPYTYAWSPREGLSDGTAANPVANPIQTMTYTVTVTDANGCQASAPITVTVTPCNKADAGDDRELCVGTETRLGPARVDTTHGARYSWAPINGLSSPNIAMPIASPSKSTAYVLTVRNRYECIDTDTVRVGVFAAPTVDAGKAQEICPGGASPLRAVVNGGQPPYRVAWAPSEGLTDVTAAATTARPSTSTTYQVTVTDARGCVATDSVRVTVGEALHIAMARNVAACRGQGTAIGGVVEGGRKPYKIFWSPAGGLSNRNVAAPVVTPVGDVTYTVTITDARGCQLVDSVRVDMFESPVATIHAESSTDICEGETVTLRAADGFTHYRWTLEGKGTVYESTRSEAVAGDVAEVLVMKHQAITVREPGLYRVTVENTEGCTTTSDPVRVRVFDRPQPRIVALGPLTFCEGDSVVLDAGKGYAAYRWSDGSTGRSLAVRTAGNWSVTVTGEGGCTADATPVTTDTRPVPLARLTQRRDTLIADPAPEYRWLRDGKPLRGARTLDGGRMLIADRDGRYQVRIANTDGCEALSDARDLRFGRATVALPTITVRGGDTIDIPLRLRASRGLDAAGAGALTALVAVKKKTLHVISGADVQSETDTELLLRVPGRYEPGGTVLANVRAVITARRGQIPLELRSVAWHGALVRGTRNNGRLRVR
jgi:hypothetical protein